ncbi:hypothetical protein Tco_1093505 [Tanacetum coccineum]|uniref:Retrovirus-related Pol polyprotein from transposon TNT 1-94-like beta-barrel domain-containing protein n=1 Tax=Tanacetum coccineum TaxID=301880 RepID=A0ABQ5IFB0_9ASTR
MVNYRIAWVVDSGATDHISISLTVMHNTFTCNPPILINLPNGQTVEVNICGSVRINSEITLTNVFYVPSFSYILLFISKLTKEMPIAAILTSLSCSFQTLNKKIAHETLCEGLYIIFPETTNTTTSSQTTAAITKALNAKTI